MLFHMILWYSIRIRMRICILKCVELCYVLSRCVVCCDVLCCFVLVIYVVLWYDMN